MREKRLTKQERKQAYLARKKRKNPQKKKLERVTMQAIELFLDNRRGVYIPKNFAEMIDRDRLKCDNGAIHELDETLDYLLECDPYGDDSDLYWQEWQCLVDNCYIEREGYLWRLWHDGDLWLYCEDLMTDQEKLDFFGEV